MVLTGPHRPAVGAASNRAQRWAAAGALTGTGTVQGMLDSAELLAAAARVGRALPVTPLEHSARLSGLAGRPVWLKREDRQPVRSYKARGAYNFIARAREAAGTDGSVDASGVRHLVAASAGNHAQGVAWCGAQLGLDVTVVLPERTPRQKRDRIAAVGAGRVRIELVGGLFDDAARRAGEIATRTGGLLVPAFDDPYVIAGQATVTQEVLWQLEECTPGAEDATLVVPVGGGGLAAGARCVLDADRSGRRWQLVAAEPAGAASLHAAWAAGEVVDLAEVDPFVDGAAVRRVGAHPWAILADRGGRVPVDGVVVEEGAVASAMLDLYQHDGIIAEPAGALAVAGLMERARQGELRGEGPIVCVVSGGNNDVSRYGEVLERSLVHRGLKHYFLVEFPQQPGALRRFLDEVLGPDDDITLFEYVKKSNRETGPALVGIELTRPGDLEGLLVRLDAGPVRATRLEMGSPLARLLL